MNPEEFLSGLTAAEMHSFLTDNEMAVEIMHDKLARMTVA